MENIPELTLKKFKMDKLRYDANGDFNGYLGFALAASERKQAVKALAKATHELSVGTELMDERNHEADLLNKLGINLQNCLTLEEAYTVLEKAVPPIFPNQYGALYVLNEPLNRLEIVASWGDGPLKKSVPLDDCAALQQKRPLYIIDTESDNCQFSLAEGDSGDFKQRAYVPLYSQLGSLLGVFHMSSDSEEFMDGYKVIERWRQRIETVGIQLSLSLANLKLRENLHQLSIRDPLTNLFNRRYLMETFEREVHIALRHEYSIGVIMLDIDHFKQFNDAYGHDVGDHLLTDLSQFILEKVRIEDIACRYGGDEFIILLPMALLRDTVRRAEELCKDIKVRQFNHLEQPLGQVTLSVGVASCPEHGSDVETLLRAVDMSMYRAKRDGRDRVAIVDPTSMK